MLRPVTQEARISQTAVRPAFSYTNFARQLAHQPTTTGAIAPSSKSLAKKVIEHASLATAKTVVELGPGTGVFTEEILRSLNCNQKFFAIELNQSFVTATKNRCPDASVYHAAATTLPVWLNKNHCTHTDRVISSLPWTIIDETEQNEMMNIISNALPPGGVFVSIVYLGARYRSRGRYFINNLKNHYSSVSSTPTVWLNLPPTQIYRCVK